MKRVLIMLLLLITAMTTIAASSMYLKASYDFSYDSNVFSNPLPKFADSVWLNNKVEDPFYKRTNNGLSLTLDVFKTPTSRTGFSVNTKLGFANKSINYVPVGDFNSDSWSYERRDVLEETRCKVFMSIGPIFRARVGKFDLGAAVRGSIGSDDRFTETIVVGVQVEPYLNYFISNSLFINAGVYYDSHIMCFYINDRQKWFKEDYSAISIGAFIGVGIKIGE